MQWLRLELGNGRYAGRPIIKEAALEQTRLPTIIRSIDPKTGVAGFYGMGWNVDFRDRRRVEHAGAFSSGARTLGASAADGEDRHRDPERLPTGVLEGLGRDLPRRSIHREARSRDRLEVPYWNEIYDTNLGAGARRRRWPPMRRRRFPVTTDAARGLYGASTATTMSAMSGSSESGGVLLSVALGPAGKRLPLKHFQSRSLPVCALCVKIPAGWSPSPS